MRERSITVTYWSTNFDLSSIDQGLLSDNMPVIQFTVHDTGLFDYIRVKGFFWHMRYYLK